MPDDRAARLAEATARLFLDGVNLGALYLGPSSRSDQRLCASAKPKRRARQGKAGQGLARRTLS